MLNRKQWLILGSATVWFCLCALIVRGISAPIAFSWHQQDRLPSVTEAFFLLCVTLPPLLIAGRRMALGPWLQWGLLFTVSVWAGFLGWIALTAPSLDEAFAALVLALAFGSVIAGLFIGLFGPPGLTARLKQWFATPERKQLGVLLAAAAWVTLMVIDGAPPHYGSLFVGRRETWADSFWGIFAKSLPAFLLAGILFWWFGRKTKD